MTVSTAQATTCSISINSFTGLEVMQTATIKAMAVIGAAAVLCFGAYAFGGASVVVNGNFENDGRIDSITPASAPERWTDVNIPSNLFGGYVYDGGWSTYPQGGYCLTVFSRPYRTFTNTDIAAVSEHVYFHDVNEIVFDLKLETDWNDPWDPARRSAVVLIDDEVVWESNNIGPDVRGEYLRGTCTIDEKYKDPNAHKLSLALRSNVNESTIIKYSAKWDFVRFDTHCQGFGYLWADLNTDCVVDLNDLVLLSANWLRLEPGYKYDLFEDSNNIVDGRDFSVFAEWWLTDSWQYQPADELLAYDLNNDGVVDFLDYAVLTGGRDLADYDSVFDLTSQWLLKSWLYRLY